MCEHIEQIRVKLKNFIEKVRDHDSYIYKKLDSVVNKEDIKLNLRVKKKGWFSDDYEPTATYKAADFPYVSVEALEELCKEIDELLDLCNCYEDEHEEKLKTKRKNTELKKQVIAKDLEFKELIKGNVTNEAKLEVSEEKTKELKSEIKPIREENLQKTKELAEKEAEIFSLHRQLAQCKVKASDSELNLAEKELNNIAKRFEIEKKHKKELCDVYRQLVRLREKRGDNKTEIDNAEKKKADILDELEKKIDDENNVLDFSRQCEKVEVLKFQLEEFKQQQRQLEAHQEYRRP